MKIKPKPKKITGKKLKRYSIVLMFVIKSCTLAFAMYVFTNACNNTHKYTHLRTTRSQTHAHTTTVRTHKYIWMRATSPAFLYIYIYICIIKIQHSFFPLHKNIHTLAGLVCMCVWKKRANQQDIWSNPVK